MSEPIEARQRSLRADQIRRRLNQLKANRHRGMFGFAEIIGVSVSLLMLLLVLVSYFYFLLPAQSRLSAQQRERERLQTLLRTSSDVLKHDEDTKQIAEKITGSLEEFEFRLANQSEGRMDLYDDLNDLIRTNGLRNTSGPTYTTLEPAGSKAAKKSTATKWQSVYPGIAVAVTVEGQYQNIRHFIRDLEASKQFIVINGVELERATETNTPLSAEGTPATPRGSLVSLRMDLATYFRRTPADTGDVNGEQKQ